MSEELKWAGTVRGIIREFGLKEQESGAVAVSIVADIVEFFDDGEWKDCREHGYESRGDIWIVKSSKSGGGMIENNIKALMQHAGWDGAILSIADGTWRPTPCAFTIEKDEYKDQVRYKIAWINDYERKPGGVGNVTTDKAKLLQDQYGSQLRALAGNFTRNKPAPGNGKPVPPPKPKAAKPAPTPQPASNDDVPF